MSWVKACRADIAAGECKGVQVNGVPLAIFNVEGELHATSNICTHQHALLSDGYLEGDFIECPLHQARFNVKTGASEGLPDAPNLQVFALRIENGEVMVEIMDQAATT